MKHIIITIAVLCCFCITLSACSDDKSSKNSVSLSDVISESPYSSSNSASVSSGEIDVDLTKLSSTMIYSEVYNMIISPNSYTGKTVKMKGQFAVYHNIATGGNYFAVVIADATACCQQGLEFVLRNNAVYPDDYPAENQDITVQGVFETYNEGENQYCHLVNAEIVL